MTLYGLMMISNDKFKIIVENTPLISIDFIIEKEGKFLLGKRVNEPAAGYWFTLGGRIFKDESIEKAVERLSQKEFNQKITLNSLEFHGIYEHFYPNSYVDEAISTHYVVLAYLLKEDQVAELPMNEHCEYCYFSKEELLVNSNVHPYVKNYFKEN